MKIYKYIMYALLAFAFATFALIIPGEAQAQTVTCVAVTKSVNTWPYTNNWLQRCTGSSPNAIIDANEVGDTLYAMRSPGFYTSLSAKIDADEPTFWVFNTSADFVVYCQAHPTQFSYLLSMECPTVGTGTGQIGAAALGFTSIPPTPNAGYSVIVANNINAKPIDYNFEESAAHELGHWADFWYRAKLGGASRASSTTKYLSEFDRDMVNLDAKTPTCGTATLFYGGKSELFHWICSQVRTITIGGTRTVGDRVTVNLSDSAWSPKTAVYTVQSGHTTTALMAAGLKAAIDAVNIPSISTTVSGSVVTIYSKTGNDTLYSVFRTGAGGGTPTITAALAASSSSGTQLATEFAGKTNSNVLKAAHPYRFAPTQMHDNFAETVASVTGHGFPGGSFNPTSYFNEHMDCTEKLVLSLLKTGYVPGDPLNTDSSVKTFPSGFGCPALGPPYP